MKTNSKNNPEFRVELSGHVLENALRREVETRNDMLIDAIMHFVPNDTLYKVLMHDYPEPQFAVGDIVDVVDVARGRIPVAPCTPFVVQSVSVFGSYRQQPEYTLEYGCLVQQEDRAKAGSKGEERLETRTLRVEQSQIVASGEQFALSA